jgi:Zn-finger nucleic acid-binding protein
MQCPVDGAVLEMSERQGVEIDYCPTCRGVWLDRGELDKIVERSDSYDRSFDRARDDRPRYEQPYRKKRKSFLSELFDD